MKAVIFTNGEYQNKVFYEDYLVKIKPDYIICADGGANYAKELNVRPDIILGDMDSITEETKAFYQGREFLYFPPKKDETDTELAIAHAIAIGAKEVTILGGLGSRMDHSLGNIYLLKRFFDADIKAEIVNENNIIRLIGRTAEFQLPIGTVVSLLPIGGDVEGLTITGFEYPIDEGRMTMNNPYGISNVTNLENQKIAFKQGMLLVIIPKD
ncbi:MAG: thiamine diphosphokinase [Acetobacterium woodii]|nr:thiamine diphosphokinase [Acetobacterium woodii]